MHSRIIELGNAPILPDDRMGECSVPEWFYHSIADYTNAETNRDEDLKWFLEIVAHIVDVAEDGESFTFKPNAKKKYFHRQYYAFLDKARELTGISIEAFCAETPYDIGMAMYKLNEAYQDSVSALRGPFGTVTAPGSYSSSSSQERIRAMLIVFILRIPVTKIRNLSSFSEYSKRYGLQTKEWRTPVCPWNRIRIFRFSWIARNTMRKQ